jgi:hypothetical protein
MIWYRSSSLCLLLLWRPLHFAFFLFDETTHDNIQVLTVLVIGSECCFWWSGFTTLHRCRSRAACCGSFVEGGFDLLVASYEWTWRTRRFTWFGSSERNTLRLRENWFVLLKHVCLSMPFHLTPVKRCLPGPFIAQARVIKMRPRAPQVAPRWLKRYTSSSTLGVANDVLHGVSSMESSCLLTLLYWTWSSLWCHLIRSYHHCSHVQKWLAGTLLHCWTEL